MHTSLDCLPCFLTQALKGARLAAPAREDIHQRVVQEWAAEFANLDLTLSPPALAGRLYALLADSVGDVDPFRGYKEQSNMQALRLLPRLEELVRQQADPLRAALGVSIIGNYMDAGVQLVVDVEDALSREDIGAVDDDTYVMLRQRLTPGASVMILGDNAGEIAFDTLLVRQLAEAGCVVTYVVRGVPIINDATMEDARFVGMTDLCEVVSSGVDTPGTVLERCAPGFVDRMASVDVVLSKGQGNFEALRDNFADAFFAFKAKCPKVAGLCGVPQGTSMLHYESS